jgi:hypothetical protein
MRVLSARGLYEGVDFFDNLRASYYNEPIFFLT